MLPTVSIARGQRNKTRGMARTVRHEHPRTSQSWPAARFPGPTMISLLGLSFLQRSRSESFSSSGIASSSSHESTSSTPVPLRKRGQCLDFCSGDVKGRPPPAIAAAVSPHIQFLCHQVRRRAGPIACDEFLSVRDHTRCGSSRTHSPARSRAFPKLPRCYDG